MKYLTQDSEDLALKLTKKEAECIELYDMLDSKYTQLVELVKENTEAIELLKMVNPEGSYTLVDMIKKFLIKIEK